jgi:hypothetical protein
MTHQAHVSIKIRPRMHVDSEPSKAPKPEIQLNTSRSNNGTALLNDIKCQSPSLESNTSRKIHE